MTQGVVVEKFVLANIPYVQRKCLNSWGEMIAHLPNLYIYSHKKKSCAAINRKLIMGFIISMLFIIILTFSFYYIRFCKDFNSFL